MKNETCCFTGHRQLPPGERAEIANRLERVITALYQRGVRYYGAGGALGFDAIAAQTVIRLRKNCPGMKLILVLPCLTQTRGWRPENVMEYERIKAQADKVVYTAQQYTPGCMHKRNRHLVDNSSVCVCYLNRESGGTAYTVDYAEKKGLEIINLAPVQRQKASRQNRRLVHICVIQVVVLFKKVAFEMPKLFDNHSAAHFQFSLFRYVPPRSA